MAPTGYLWFEIKQRGTIPAMIHEVRLSAFKLTPIENNTHNISTVKFQINP
jgi:hypothetical protein